MRIDQWHHLAELHSQLKHQLDATICWGNLLWYEGHVTAGLTQQWLNAELRVAGRNRLDIRDVRSLISQLDKRPRDASLVAAYVVHVVSSRTGIHELSALASGLTQYFEQQEQNLPVRVVWLTASAMHELVGGDPLGLARVRDRLLDRLYEHGLLGEFDIVSLLRGGSQNQNDHHRALRARWQELFARVLHWLARA